MHDFKAGEVKHLKAALKSRDATITDLSDRVRVLEAQIVSLQADMHEDACAAGRLQWN